MSRADKGRDLPRSRGDLVRLADRAPVEGESALAILTVGSEGATLRQFRCDCRGETGCRAELGELVQLLERRHADIAVFLCDPSLAGPLVEELRRRGKDAPGMVITLPPDVPRSKATFSVLLSGLSESSNPLEILARLYDALRAVQGAADPAPTGRAEVGQEPEVSSDEAAYPPPGTTDAGPTSATAPDGAPPGSGAATTGLAQPAALPPPRQVGSPAETDGDSGMSIELEEMSARLERVLDQRLRQRSQP